jgi:hypothetical protein
MAEENSKKGPDFWSLLIACGILVVSYLVLYYLPQDTTWKFWAIFVASIFLFCIGYFGLIDVFPNSKNGSSSTLFRCITSAFAAGMFAVGLYYVYIANGSYPSLAVCTLLLIEGVTIFSSAFSETGMTQAEAENRNMCILAVVVLMALLGFVFFFKEILSETTDNVGRIETATMLWIGAAAVYEMCSVDLRYYIEKMKTQKKKGSST